MQPIIAALVNVDHLSHVTTSLNSNCIMWNTATAMTGEWDQTKYNQLWMTVMVCSSCSGVAVPQQVDINVPFLLVTTRVHAWATNTIDLSWLYDFTSFCMLISRITGNPPKCVNDNK